MKILPTLLLLFLTVSNTLAVTKEATKDLREYDVEIIIFEDAHARYIDSEIWQQYSEPEKITETLTETTVTTDAIKKLDELSLSEIKATDYNPIPAEILNSEYKRIKTSSEYKVLFYGAWRQAGLDNKKAFEINIEELKNTHKASSENTITGHFKLVLARYLHFYSKLDYQRNTDDVINETTAEDEVANEEQTETQPDNLRPGELTSGELTPKNNIYPMNIHRRMRSKELHYIDHPLVGILIQINPVEIKQIENAEKEAKQ